MHDMVGKDGDRGKESDGEAVKASVGSVLSGIKKLVGANNLGAVEFVVIKV